MRRDNRTKSLVFRILGLLLCTVPVTLCILCYFPLWGERDSLTVLSGFSILLLTLGAIPLFKLIKRSLRSPSAHTLWFIIFVIFFCAERIADEMTVISFVGFIGNLLGALCFRIGRARRGASESDEG